MAAWVVGCGGLVVCGRVLCVMGGGGGLMCNGWWCGVGVDLGEWKSM